MRQNNVYLRTEEMRKDWKIIFFKKRTKSENFTHKTRVCKRVKEPLHLKGGHFNKNQNERKERNNYNIFHIFIFNITYIHFIVLNV